MGWFEDWIDKGWQFNASWMTGGLSDLALGIKKGIETEGPWYEKIGAGIDRSLDPGGSVDYSLRTLGSILPDSGGFKQALPAIGGAVGGTIGSVLLPGIGTVGGAAAGAGIGSKLAGDTYAAGFLNAGISGATAYAGSALSGALSGLTSGATAGVTSAELAAIADSGIDVGVEGLSQIPMQTAEQAATASAAAATPAGFNPLSSYTMGGSEAATKEAMAQAIYPQSKSPYSMLGNTQQTGEYAKPIMIADQTKKGFDIPWKKIGDIGKELADALGKDGPIVPGMASDGSNPVDIYSDFVNTKGVTNEGLSKATKASLLWDGPMLKPKMKLSDLELGAMIALQNWKNKEDRKNEFI